MNRKGDRIMKNFRLVIIVLALTLGAALVAGPNHAVAASAASLNRDARVALDRLCAKSIKASALAEKATAILVFPSITKAGFIVGGQYGEGVLLRNGRPIGYYNNVSASYGLQAGIQTYGYALFFMTEGALQYLDRSDGWELGTAPNIVIVDTGAAAGLSTTSIQSDMFAFFFNQKGLMAGLGLQGTKITRITK
jgi:lipid-binding SYLF domain-containing protein